MEEEANNETNIIEKHENEPMGNKNLEDLEQRVHELDAKWKQVKEERDSIMLENEELQEQLDMANSAQSAGNIRMNEFRNDLNKVTEEVARLEYVCTSQEHELKTVSDKMCDLNSIKETVKELTEETNQFKEDFSRMRTHLNVAAKLELQTQEKMYESRLHHLENVLEEMKQREGHFVHLAEETAVLKDQVDALRELSVMTLKNDNSIVDNGYSHDRRMSDKEAKAHAAAAEANAAHYAAIMGSCSGSSMPQLLLAQSPMSTQSEDNTLAKEFQAMEAQRLLQTENSDPSAPSPLVIEAPTHRYEMEPLQRSSPQEVNESDPVIDNNNGSNNNEGEVDNNNDVTNEVTDDTNLVHSHQNLLSGNESEYDNARLMLLDLDESKRLPGIKVSGTLKLRSRDPLMDNFYENNDMKEIGCFPNWFATVWTNLFD